MGRHLEVRASVFVEVVVGDTEAVSASVPLSLLQLCVELIPLRLSLAVYLPVKTCMCAFVCPCDATQVWEQQLVQTETAWKALHARLNSVIAAAEQQRKQQQQQDQEQQQPGSPAVVGVRGLAASRAQARQVGCWCCLAKQERMGTLVCMCFNLCW